MEKLKPIKFEKHLDRYEQIAELKVKLLTNHLVSINDDIILSTPGFRNILKKEIIEEQQRGGLGLNQNRKSQIAYVQYVNTIEEINMKNACKDTGAYSQYIQSITPEKYSQKTTNQ